VLAPATTTGTPRDFAPGDPITNPPGPDVWLPTAFRAVHFDSFPRLVNGPASYLSNNLGLVQLTAGLLVTSNALSLADARSNQKDGNPPFEYGVDVSSCTRSAIRVYGDVDEVNGAAIDLAQTFGRPHRIRWLHRGNTLSSTLHADPAGGNFVFAGGDLDLGQRGTLRQSGLSATATAARNLSGVEVPVAAGATELAVTFPPDRDEQDAAYGVLVESSWITARAVTDKQTTGFKVRFGTAVPAGGGRLDWLLVR
jgi:hypothetical protein